MRYVLILVFSFCFISCSLNGNENNSDSTIKLQKGKIVLTGSSTLAPLVSEIGKKFEKLNPEIRVDVQTGGSSRGINDAREGLADIGMSSRALLGEEINLHSIPIAKDGVTFLVHKENPINSLSNDQLKGIYTGKINNWSEVGGKDAEIIVINRTEGRSELELITEYFGIKKSDIDADVIAGENEHGIKTVAANINSIIYMSIGSSIFNSKLGIPIKLLPLDGVEPDFKNIQSGKFPLLRPLILITKNQPMGLTNDFISFARSGEVNDIVEEQFFVPVSN